jgi:hypothetical protein
MSNQSSPERYPQIRATSGYTDPRIRSTGPGPGAGVEHDPERSSMLSGRTVIVASILIGQLWALAIGVDQWMSGHTGPARWLAAFSTASFLVALALWRVGRGSDR